MRHTAFFFEFIRSRFGVRTCVLLKNFIKLSKLNIMLRIRIRFIRS